MSASRLELLRSACEAVETAEHALAMAFTCKSKYAQQSQKASEGTVSATNVVWWDSLIQRLTNVIEKKSKEILSIYADENGSLKQEQNLFCGKEFLSVASAEQKHDQLDAAEPNEAAAVNEEKELGEDNNLSTTWDNFYGKLNEMQVSILGHMW